MIQVLKEALGEWGDSHKWPSSSDGSATATVTFNTILILVLPIICIYLVPAIYSLSWSLKLRLKGQPPLPPGSLGFPIIGETLSFFANRHKFGLSRHTKHGPIFKSNVMGETVFLKAPAGNKLLFTSEAKLVQMIWPTGIQRLLGPDSFSMKNGSDYKRTRRHINPFLSPAALAQYVPRIEEKVKRHLAESWQPSVLTQNDDDQGFELSISESVDTIAYAIIADLILSLDPRDPDTEKLRGLHKLWTAGLVSVPLDLPGTTHYRGMKGRAGILAILDKLIARRREELKEGKATPTQDFLSYLLTQPDDSGELNTDGEMKDNLLVFLHAGHATSSHVMTLTLRSIALYPEVYERLKKEHDSIAERKSHGESLTKDDLNNMNYTWCVIQETMRVVAPIPGGFRETIKDFEYEGFTIPKGWKISWNTGSHKDPRFWEDPEKFDPLRFDGRHEIETHVYCPFGGGPRICPGNEFAKIEMLTYMHCVLRNYKLILVDPDEPILYGPFPRQKSGTLMKIWKLR